MECVASKQPPSAPGIAAQAAMRDRRTSNAMIRIREPVSHQTTFLASMACVARARHSAVGDDWPRMMQASCALPAAYSIPGEVGRTCHVNKAAAIPNTCHQLAGSAPEERTCCHCTTEKPTATTTGIASTSAAIRIEAEFVTM